MTLPVALTAVPAEAAGDLFARVGGLADLFGFPGRDLEVGTRNKDVIAVVAARDLAAVGTVAERLVRRKKTKEVSSTVTKTHIPVTGTEGETHRHRRLTGVFHLDISTEAASGRHVGQGFLE